MILFFFNTNLSSLSNIQGNLILLLWNNTRRVTTTSWIFMYDFASDYAYLFDLIMKNNISILLAYVKCQVSDEFLPPI